MADRSRLDQPRELRGLGRARTRREADPERFGRFAESAARFLGTARFIFWMTVFIVVWVAWNVPWGPDRPRWDEFPFIFLTLILSLQASYAAPLILLAQNRQDDRDRVQIEQDRQRAERNLADTEFLAREVVALRLALKDLPDRDFLRAELRSLLAELEAEKETPAEAPEAGPGQNDAAHRAAE